MPLCQGVLSTLERHKQLGEWPSSTGIAVKGIPTSPAFIEGERERFKCLSAYHTVLMQTQVWCRGGVPTVQWLALGEWPSSTGIAVGGIPMSPAFIEGEQERYGLLAA